MNNEEIKDSAKTVLADAQPEANTQESVQPEANVQETAQTETAAPQESYAVRPHHRQRRLIDYNGRDKMFKVRNSLNIVFMVLAVIGLLVYTQTDYTTLSYVILLIGVVLKIAEVVIRMFKK